MTRFSLAVTLMLMLLRPALALDVGEISAFMPGDSARLSKEIKNTTDSGRLVTIKIERISSPLASGTVIPMNSRDEILLSPASLILPANASDVIRFYYKGPNDAQERYYRIVWFDQALSEAGQNSARRNAVATTSARIGTILVVAPRQDRFAYQFANGRIKNTGNATFKVVAYGNCRNKQDGSDCKENYFVMPGKDRAFSKVDVNDKKGRVALWHGEQFIPVK
ncbi:EcpB family pilus assembly chaperone [Serratia nevei]|uniref:EcpB family pilus assembly chaperone n=1 Tax=Serratia nevei TaxID=2703794 RepID=UPI003FA6FDCE